MHSDHLEPDDMGAASEAYVDLEPEAPDEPVDAVGFGRAPAEGGILWSLPMRSFDFGSLDEGTTTQLVLAAALCVEVYRELRLVVRVHKADVGFGGQIAVELRAVAPTDEEPGVRFAAAGVLARVVVDVMTDPGTLLMASPPSPLPTHIEVGVAVTMPDPIGGLVAVLGVDVEGRR